jgi:arsenite methyltransferase
MDFKTGGRKMRRIAITICLVLVPVLSLAQTTTTMVVPGGKVVGVEMSSEMLDRAGKNLSQTDLKNISFLDSSGEGLPLPDEDYDVVISSGVFNLIPDKLKALREVFRVTKPGGRLMVADQVLTGSLPEDAKARVDTWSG